MSSSSKDGLLAVCSILTGLSIIFVGLRFHARVIQKLPLQIDDWIMIPALVTYVGAAICNFISVGDKVLGYSTHDFTKQQTLALAPESQKLYFAIGLLLIFTLALTKISALFFYRRIFCFRNSKHWFNIVSIVSIVIVVAWLVNFTIMAGLACGTHFSARWDGTYSKYCKLPFPYQYGLAVSDFLLDIWILALPIPVIIRLQMTLSKKLSIIGLFFLAFIGLGASIARMVQYIQVETGGDPGLFSDIELSDTMSFYFNMLEAGISLTAVNFPSLWLYFTNILPETFLRSVRSVLSLGSTRGSAKPSSGPDGGSTVHLHYKPNTTSSSVKSGRPDAFPAELAHNNRHHQQAASQQLAGIKKGQGHESIAMRDLDMSTVSPPQGRIYRGDTFEVGREMV